MKLIMYVIVMLCVMGVVSAADSVQYGNSTYGVSIDRYGLDVKQEYPTTKFFYGMNHGMPGFVASAIFPYAEYKCVMDFNFINCMYGGKKYFSVTPQEMVIPVKNCATGKLTTDAMGKIICSPDPVVEISGWSGTCPANHNVIVKNGLVVDCKPKK